jgi:hypothetical protein
MELNEVATQVSIRLSIELSEAKKIVNKARLGGEINASCDPDKWLNDRFLPNVVPIDEDGYARMCIDALKTITTTVATDFGGSRQRDLSQLWADKTRGYLGELAFVNWLRDKWGIEAELGHEQGSLEEYLPMDIHRVKKKGEVASRAPNLKIGVKATKWNGVWLDIWGSQFYHSDIHVLVKVGTGREHLVGYLKKISVFKDKILSEGKRIKAIDQDEADQIFKSLPSYEPISAYICGFVAKRQSYTSLSYAGQKKRKHYTISSWNGPIERSDLESIRTKEGLTKDAQIKFEGIGKFAHDKGYVFNAGNLHWRNHEWKPILDEL